MTEPLPRCQKCGYYHEADLEVCPMDAVKEIEKLLTSWRKGVEFDRGLLSNL